MTINYQPTEEEQQQTITNCKGGVNIDVLTNYSINPPPDDKTLGETIISENTFIQYFRPTELQCMCKVFIFVIDVSGSMYGLKIRQTKQAALHLMDQLDAEDYFNIITFSTSTNAYNPTTPVSVGMLSLCYIHM